MERHHESDDQELDERLRRVLEPHPLSVERLVRTALQEGDRGKVRTGANAWPRLAVVTVLLLLAVAAIPFFVKSPPPRDPTPIAEEVPERSTPVRISISNADGYVKISSTAGPTWIVLPGDES